MPLFEQLTLAISSNERGKLWPLDSGSKSRYCFECEQDFNVFCRKHQCVQCLHTVCRDCLQPGYFYTQGAQGVGQSAPETPSRVCKHCYELRRPAKAKDSWVVDWLMNRSALERAPDKPPAPELDERGEAAAKAASHPQHATAAQPPRGAGGEDSKGGEPAGPAEPGLPPLPRPAKTRADKAAGKQAVDQAVEGRRGKVRDGALTWDAAPPLEVPQALLDSMDPPQEGCDPGSHPVASIYRAPLAAVGEQHLATLMVQLLLAVRVSDIASWSSIITKLAARAAAMLDPVALARHGVSDPRYYIRVKRVADTGMPQDSSVVQGVVARKNVSHRRMRKRIANPRILLLGNTLEFHRTHHRLASFDHYTKDQETEHLRLAVERLAAMQLDVLLVEKSVARDAQDALLDRNISLALNVKRSTLDHLARCTGAQVATSLADLSSASIATCQEFEVEELTPAVPQAVNGQAHRDPPPAHRSTASTSSQLTDRPATARTLMSFRGCPQRLGASIILRGASHAELGLIKRVMQFAAYVAYRGRLEHTFLAHELASAFASAHGIDDSTQQPSWQPACGLSTTLPVSETSQLTFPGQPGSTSAKRLGATSLQSNSADQASLAGCTVADLAGQAESVAQESCLAAANTHASTMILSASPHVSSGWLAPEASPGRPSQARDETPVRADIGHAESRPPLREVEDKHEEYPEPAAILARQVPRLRLSPGPEERDDPLSQAVRELMLAHTTSDASSIIALALERGDSVDAGLLDGAGHIYDCQRLFVSVARRNPSKSLLCEPPKVQRISYYDAETDVSLAAFLKSASPHQQKTCPHQGCGDGATAHLHSFLHMSGMITLSITQLPPDQELPGGPEGRIWFWARPQGAGAEPVASVRRIPLSPEAGCISFGHFLELGFGMQHFSIGGRPLHRKFARYFGMGAFVACFHYEHIDPNHVLLPPHEIAQAATIQQRWLQEEVEELIEDANSTFDAINSALLAMKSDGQPLPSTPDTGAGIPGDNEALQRLRAELASEGTTISQAVQEVCAAVRAEPASGLLLGRAVGQERSGTEVATGDVEGSVWAINRVRRMLTVMSHMWAARLQHPQEAAQSLSRQNSGVGMPTPEPGEASPLTQQDPAEQPQGRVGEASAASVPSADAPAEGAESETRGAMAGLPSLPLPAEQNAPAKQDWPAQAEGRPPELEGAAEPAAVEEEEPAVRPMPLHPASQSTGSLVWQRVQMFERNNPPLRAISMPGWSRDKRQRSATDSVLKWLSSSRGSARSRPGDYVVGQSSEADQGSDEDGDSDSSASENGFRSHQASDADIPSSSPTFDGIPAHRNLTSISDRGERDPRHLEKTARMRAGLAAEMKRVRAEGDNSARPAGQPTDTPFGKVQLQNGDGRAAAAPPPALQPAARQDGAGAALSSSKEETQPHLDADCWETVIKSVQSSERAAESSAPAESAGGDDREAEVGAMATSASLPVLTRPGVARSVCGQSGVSQVSSSLLTQQLSPEALRSLTQQLPLQPSASKADLGSVNLPHGQVKLTGHAMLPVGADDRVVVVRDEEPTSLVAYALASREHQAFLKDATAFILYGGPKPGAAPAAKGAKRNLSSGDLISMDASDLEAVSGHHSRNPSLAGTDKEGLPSVAPSSLGNGKMASANASDTTGDWRLLLSAEPLHFHHSVNDSVLGSLAARSRMQMTALFAPQFAELRRRCCAGGENAYLASLSRCRTWDARGGKTRAYFAKTSDDRYIVKQLQGTERKSFLEIAPAYFRYLAQAMRKNMPTCLAKITGVYTVVMRGGSGGKETSMDILVMENVFYDAQLFPIYDLKGSERARLARDDPSDPSRVLMDQNLVQANLSSPILVDQEAHARLERALWADTAFLAGLGVMDYSLLVGVNRADSLLVVGIIDFIRQYTWDKALEKWVKSGMGLGKDLKAPTIQSPKEYCRRFRVAMSSYFTRVPSDAEPPPSLDPDANL